MRQVQLTITYTISRRTELCLSAKPEQDQTQGWIASLSKVLMPTDCNGYLSGAMGMLLASDACFSLHQLVVHRALS